MTGAEFYLYLQQKYDKAYSSYLDATKANRLIKEAMYRLVDKLSSLLDTQKEYDELSELLKYDHSITATTNTATIPADYYHLMRMAFTFVDQITFTVISGATVTASKHGLRKGDKISVLADGTGTLKTVTKVTSTSFTVDSAFSPVPTNIYLVRLFEGSPSQSDRKKGILSNGVKESPKYWTGSSGTSKVWFLEPSPKAVTIDYILVPPVNIDVSNSVINLNDTYTEKFLYRLMDECVYGIAEQTRDYNQKQSVQQTIIENP
jgi:hypothetical protein